MEGNWLKNSACVKQTITRDSATVSMTPDHERNIAAEHLLHCMSPESYWEWAEEQHERNPVDMETLWDE
jgi:hypothetical protein